LIELWFYVPLDTK